eukprot:CAMPEP_0119125956 /NCGR_PEP_ID=MMETSP1310-20130426/5051_1 /TAXON_ID=464262 /ORGANISM="Genus nov. species nov., Strain RCC2339" /LENGTH=1050 /DNA_ID=CAMNT_0007116077 /DNA_START=84 /DNA_END=3236 /DNA_ORIENTATION=+
MDFRSSGLSLNRISSSTDGTGVYENDILCKMQVSEVLSRTAASYFDKLRVFDEALAALVKAVGDLSYAESEISKGVSLSCGGDLQSISPHCLQLMEGISTSCASRNILRNSLKDVSDSHARTTTEVMESFMRIEVPVVNQKRASLLKSYTAYTDILAKKKSLTGRKDAQKLFEVEHEESVMLNAYKEEKETTVSLVDDFFEYFYRVFVGSSISFSRDLVKAFQGGSDSFQQVDDQLSTLEPELQKARKSSFARCRNVSENLGAQEVVRQGLLLKKAGQGRHWQNRMVVLKPRYLYYLDEKILKGFVVLQNCSTFPAGRTEKKPLCFQIDQQGSTRSFKFEAKDQRELEQWVEAIEECTLLEETIPEVAPLGGSFAEPSNPNTLGDSRYEELMSVYTTEKIYLSNLEGIKSYRFNIQRENILFNQEGGEALTKLFGFIDDFFKLHAQLLPKIELATKDWPTNAFSIGRAFITALPTFQKYIAYAKEYSAARIFLTKSIDTNPNIKKLLESLQRKNSSEYDLTGLLSLPLNRVDRYCLLLQQYCDHTPSSEAEYENFTISLASMTELSETMEGLISFEKSASEVYKVSKTIVNYPGELCKPGRSLLLSMGAGVLRPDEKSLAECYLFIFNDVLLVTTKKQLHIRDQYRFVDELWFYKCVLGESRADGIHLSHDGRSYLIKPSQMETARLHLGLADAIEDVGRKRQFGVPLGPIFEELEKANRDIPEWLEIAVGLVVSHYLKVEGIFRISARAEMLKKYRGELDQGKPVDMTKQTVDAHLACGLIKLWFREMPQKVIPDVLYNDLHGAVEMNEKAQKIAAYKTCLTKMPKFNLFLLQYVVSFVRVVGCYSEWSKMSKHNIAIVFGPNLLESPNPLDPGALQVVYKVLEEMMEYYDDLFLDVEKERMNRKRSKMQLVQEELEKNAAAREQMEQKQREFGVEEPGRVQSANFTSQVLKQGYLTKKGEVRRNWSTRWFVLKYNWLGYYKGPEDMNDVPKGSIVLRGCVFSPTGQRAFGFSLHDPRSNRTYQICAKNPQEYQEWCEAIQAAIKDVTT